MKNILTSTEETKNFFQNKRLYISLFLATCIFLAISAHFAFAFLEESAKNAKIEFFKSQEIEAKKQWQSADENIQNCQNSIPKWEGEKVEAQFLAETSRKKVSELSPENLGK